DLFDADGLAGQGSTQVDFLTKKTQAAAAGDHDGPIVEGVVRLRNAVVGPGGGGIDLGRRLHVQSLVGTLVIEVINKIIKLGLLLQDVGSSGSSGFLLERQVHAFMAAVLLRMTGTDALDADAKTQPPDRKLGKIEEPVGRGERNTIVGADGLGQTPFFEKTLKSGESEDFPIGLQGLTEQQITGSMVGHGERITVAFIAELELALVVGAPQMVWFQALGQGSALSASAWPAGTAYQTVTIEYGVDGACGRDLDRVRQSPQQALANLACTPVWFLAPGCDDCRFNLLGQLVGVSKGPANAVT